MHDLNEARKYERLTAKPPLLSVLSPLAAVGAC